MRRNFVRGAALAALVCSACSGGGGGSSSGDAGSGGGSSSGDDAAQRHILFVGNSFTHGRYQPVRLYNNGGTSAISGGSPLVIDDNADATGSRAEDNESGPFGGIPGIFAEFAVESGLDYDVHIEAISSATLKTHISAASSVMYDAKWDAIVLQEQSTRPLPSALAGDSNHDAAVFCSSVQSIETSLHNVAPSANVWLYETWPRADTAQTLAGSTSSSDFATNYADALQQLGDAYHDAYYRAAARDGDVAGVAPVGDAWMRAWAQGIAEPNPYTGSTGLPSLWYGINASNDPQISSADRYHPSIYGAYLSALVLFQRITGVEATTLGSGESAAASLGISPTIAVQLQQIASQTVSGADATLVNASPDPCTDF
ncbi:hypothetical protein [Solimonas marina]|uniref:PEP-CTERM sorting domain-containing protein n=1 Tax=Solimonas marina TaxID=2714601 RepID=A0A969WBT2_9GAMM|nr:hypothetical protein [Solimonas marina]NKF23215.1 hypothetical protein [Solimonas marina]